MRNLIGFLVVASWVSACHGAGAATWYVDGSIEKSGDGASWATAFQTIQEGINTASGKRRDTVLVAEGTYLENIRFNGKNIALTGTDPLNPAIVANTIIDGNQAGSVVTFSGTETEACVLSGFTIRNGLAIEGAGVRGGPSWGRTHATVERNAIVGNSAQANGGGIANSEGVVRNNIISGNTAGFGGGVFYSDGTIEDNIIAGNSADNGGGICDCDGPIRNNRITDNSAAGAGAVAICPGDIVNNTISGNSSLNGVMFDCFGRIENCIIWGNTEPVFHLCPAPVSFSCIQDWTDGGEGNIAEDPRFVDADGPDDDAATWEDNDYRLLLDSPCIDAGKNEDWMPEALDLDGNPRIAFGASSLTVDMGAYEYSPFPFRVTQVSKLAGAGVGLTWTSRPGQTYVVWSCHDLLGAEWLEEATVPSQGESTNWTTPDMSFTRRFYRIKLK